MASPLLYPAIPSPVLYLLGTLTAASMLRLLPLVFDTEPRRAAELAVLVYIVDVARYAGMAVPAIETWGFVAEVGLALVAVALARRRLAGRGGGPLRLLLTVGAAVLVASVAFDAAGYRSMSALLALGLLRSLWAGLALLLAGRVLGVALDAALRTPPLTALRAVQTHREALVRTLHRGILVLGGLAWAWLVLKSMTLSSTLVGWLSVAAAEPHTLGTIGFTLADLGRLVAGVVVAVIAAMAVRFLLRDELLPRSGLAAGVTHAVSTTAFYFALILGLVITLTAAGVQPGQFAFMAGALGLGIGFGLQNIINNFVSGLILLFGRPVEVDDYIEVGDLYGRVRRIGFRSSTVHTLEGAEVIVPNASLISNEVINWTHSDSRRRVDIAVGVAYGTDVRRVIAILEGVTNKSPDVLPDPPSQTLFTGFGDSSLDFEVRAWTHNDGWNEARSNVAVAISEALERAGIEIPFPQRDLHVRTLSPDAMRALPPRHASED